MITTGQSFPNFTLPNEDGKSVTLKDFSGKWLVLYVYPKDDTPGCTIQGKSFTATKNDFEKLGAVVVGLNQDDVTSHKSFCNKYSFKIPLLSDTQGTLLKALGIGQSEYKGTNYWNRTTVIIDPKGIVKKTYENVQPDGHEKTLLEDLKALQSSQ